MSRGVADAMVVGAVLMRAAAAVSDVVDLANSLNNLRRMALAEGCVCTAHDLAVALQPILMGLRGALGDLHESIQCDLRRLVGPGPGAAVEDVELRGRVARLVQEALDEVGRAAAVEPTPGPAPEGVARVRRLGVLELHGQAMRAWSSMVLDVEDLHTLCAQLGASAVGGVLNNLQEGLLRGAAHTMRTAWGSMTADAGFDDPSPASQAEALARVQELLAEVEARRTLAAQAGPVGAA